MHDCPSCRVPLHGYEEVCPSCGTRQAVRRGGGGSKQFSSFKSEQPGINWMPFVIVFFVVIGLAVWAASGSWIGRVVREGKPAEDPMEKLTYTDARNFIESELNSGLSAAGATNTKITWADPAAAEGTPGTPGDKTMDKPLNITVDTTLPDPNARKPIIEKIKDYMEKGKIPSITMNDSATHAHWTYNMTPSAAPPSDE